MGSLIVTTKRHTRPKDGRSLLTEAHVQQTVTELLELDGWRAFRTEHAIERNDKGRFKRRVGEVGMPDYLYVRYGPTGNTPKDCVERAMYTQALWIEFKRPGEKPRPDQNLWHHKERDRGALVLMVDDIDEFRKWYAASGLKRR
jgi:hypothetical protein